MAYSPAHQFGQIIGHVLEKAVLPGLDAIAQASNLYLDRKGDRPARQKKKKVCWLDLYGNSHDLDFVLERHGTDKIHGVPVAFVECAWRRYTKHSKNKVQEIQGAISPLSDKYECHAPFVGVILAGDYTKPAVEQLRSLHYQVVHIKYESVIAAFKTVGIDASYDEDTTDAQMRKKLARWKGLTQKKQDSVASDLQKSIKSELDAFNDELQKAIDRHITKVIVLPLHGCVQECTAVDKAIEVVRKYDKDQSVSEFSRFEVIIHYNNGNRINGEFQRRQEAIEFLENYLPAAKLIATLPVRAGVKVISGKVIGVATDSTPKKARKAKGSREGKT